MGKDEKKMKRMIFSGSFFVLGVIVTIVLTKFSDVMFPNDPIIVKEMTDSIKIVHEYKFPDFIPETEENLEYIHDIIYRKQKTQQLLQQELYYFEKMESEQKVLDSTLKQLRNRISNHNQMLITEIYNEIVEKQSILPNFKGYKSSGQSSDFQFNCPNDKTSEYIDLELKFYDHTLVDRIGCLFLTITGTRERNSKSERYHIYDQTYNARTGINLIRIKNYLKEDNVELSIGYILKSELNKEFPVFEKITCR